MKLKAFSLLEIIVALFLSAVVISAVYSGYVFTHKQFYRFTKIKTEIRSYFELSEVLNRDFENATAIIKKGDRVIEIEMIDKTIDYYFDEAYIIRTIEEQVDTLFFNVENIEIGLANEFSIKPLVDYVKLTVKNNGDNKIVSVYKQYGAITKIEE